MNRDTEDEVFFNCDVYELCGAMDSLKEAISYGKELLGDGEIKEWEVFSMNQHGFVENLLAESGEVIYG